ncbi:MAG: F0F1 ATP synthase subunit gamma [Candidatus Promineifilaceae bacterium]|nr:F0F1 ATP synthase subunit gamma [Candidatus Promineifilaceae bacterium]
MTQIQNGAERRNEGEVVGIRGNVVDARFIDRLPDLNNELVTTAGDPTFGERIVVEVMDHLDVQTVRGIALTSTQGLYREATIVDSGRPIQVPTGELILGRMFNVFGETIEAAENASRLSLMEAAESNIEERLDELRRHYHQIRQRSITSELWDIASGAEAAAGAARDSDTRREAK